MLWCLCFSVVCRATFIVAGSADPLKDEDREYAERLRAVGGKVEFREYRGLS